MSYKFFRWLIAMLKKGRMLLLRPYFMLRKSKVGILTYVGNNTLLNKSRVGKYCYIGCNCVVNSTNIGNYTSIAPGVQIGGMEHSYWKGSMSTYLSEECVEGNVTRIGNDVWIGAASIIKQGVKIGDGAVVGANSFVNKDVEPFSIVFGCPAKLYKYRFTEEVQNQLLKSRYWDLPPKEAKDLLQRIELQYEIK